MAPRVRKRSREVKRVMREVGRACAQYQLVDCWTCELLRDVFRSGETHANHTIEGRH